MSYHNLAQKIKSDLIHKAKVKKTYAKIRANELPAIQSRSGCLRPRSEESNKVENEHTEPASLELHPDRQAMLNHQAAESVHSSKSPTESNDMGRRRGKRKPKPAPFAKEMELARQEEDEIARRKKIKELNQRDRQAMARARRPDQSGKRRLGRESKVLLERVKRMVDDP